MKKLSGANFCFWVSWLVLCFSIVFCLGFCSIIWLFAPENVSEKLSSCQVCCFGGLVFFSWFSVVVAFSFLFFVVFQERKLRANRTHPTPHLVFLFLFLCPRRTGFISRFGRASFFAFCRGAVLGPRRFGVSWILSVLWGDRDYSLPSEAFFSDARRQGCLLSILLCRVLFCPFCVVCGYTFY